MLNRGSGLSSRYTHHDVHQLFQLWLKTEAVSEISLVLPLSKQQFVDGDEDGESGDEEYSLKCLAGI